MDQKRLFLAIAISLAILLGFQLLVVPHLPKPPPVPHLAESQHSDGDAAGGLARGHCRKRRGDPVRRQRRRAEDGAAAENRRAAGARFDQPAGRAAG